MSGGLQLDWLPGRYAVARLAPDHGWPHWAVWSRDLLALTRKAHELSVVCEESLVPTGVRAERGFVAVAVRGPLPFEATGVLAAIAAPLAEATIPLLAFSTFDTDVILVRADQASGAAVAWRAHGVAVAPPVSAPAPAR